MTFVEEKKGTARREMGNALLVLNHLGGLLYLPPYCSGISNHMRIAPQHPSCVNKTGIMSPDFRSTSDTAFIDIAFHASRIPNICNSLTLGNDLAPERINNEKSNISHNSEASAL